MTFTKRKRHSRLCVNREKRIRASLALITLTVSLFYAFGGTIHFPKLNIHLPERKVEAQEIISPLPKKYVLGDMNFLLLTTPTVTPKPTAIPTPTEEPVIDNLSYNEIRAEVKRVFGRYDNRAMMVLSCENSTLDPTKINTFGNVPVGSMDVGVFQINSYWNKIENIDLLKDPYVNIAIAWKKFVDSGYSFNQWTCGRNLGI